MLQYRCGNPHCNHVIALQMLHIVMVSNSGGNDASNLLALCGYCHDMYHKGECPAEAIRHWYGMLVALNHAFDRESMDLLLFLNMTKDTLWYLGDGVLHFAWVISGGLAEFTVQGGPGTAATTVTLTQRGRLLIEAWVKVDEEAYKRMLEAPAQQIVNDC